MDPKELTRQALVIDSHADSIVNHVWSGGVSLVDSVTPRQHLRQGVQALLSRCGSFGANPFALQLDLQRMMAVGMDVSFFAIDVSPAQSARLAYALDGFGALMADLHESGQDVRFVRDTSDIDAARQAGVPAILMAIEHAGALMGSLNLLWALHAFGVRSIGLTHNISSEAADGVAEAREGVGLTQFGVRLVREMNRLGVLVDLAHVSEGGFYHALETSSRPVIFSHGNARALCDHRRNLSDDQLRALRQNGGVIGLSFVPMFIDPAEPTLERLLDHVDHVIEVAGIETVGLGSDFDGGGTLLEGVEDYWRVTEGLQARGYAENEIRKILGENTRRVLQATIG